MRLGTEGQLLIWIRIIYESAPIFSWNKKLTKNQDRSNWS